MSGRRRLSLVPRFAIQSFVVIAIFVFTITVYATMRVEEMVRASAVSSLATGTNALITHSLTDAQLHSMQIEDLRSFDAVVRDAIRSDRFVAIKIWNRDRKIVYSSSGEQLGKQYRGYDNVEKALRGEIASDANTADKDESAEEADMFGDVVEVYSPIQTEPGGTPIGVFEVYMPAGPIRENVRGQLIGVWVLSIAAGLVLYLVQVRLVKNASDRLSAKEHEVDVVNARLEGSMREVEEHSVGTLRALNAAVDAKDSYTARHSLGVADYAGAIGRRIGLSAEQSRDVERAALLHDLGKIGVPEAILLKPKRLTREEFLIVRDHSEIGARIIESIPFLQDLVPIVRYHHERWDGTGYPEELSGEQIPLLARVLSVADAFEAMTSDRPYRRGMKLEAALEELRRNAGLQFDPALVQALLDALSEGDVTVRS